MNDAIKEIEELFGTKAKGNIIYFNDITYTPIPRPVANAVKAIMQEYPNLGYQIGLYSVKIFDANVRPVNTANSITASMNRRPIKSSLSDYFPVSKEEAKEIDRMEKTFTSRSELRSVLEDYFHIYDDYAKMSVQDFDSYLAEYFKNNK